jgi:hypothetical protein
LAPVARRGRQALAVHPGDVGAALTAYEKNLFARSERAAANLEICFRHEAPQSMIDRFAEYERAGT